MGELAGSIRSASELEPPPPLAKIMPAVSKRDRGSARISLPKSNVTGVNLSIDPGLMGGGMSKDRRGSNMRAKGSVCSNQRQILGNTALDLAAVKKGRNSGIDVVAQNFEAQILAATKEHDSNR